MAPPPKELAELLTTRQLFKLAPEVPPAEGEAPMPTTLLSTAIMERRAGAWYYEAYVDGDESSPRFYGQPDVCVGCHAVDGDGLRTVALP